MGAVQGVDAVGIQVFGRISASISHELKNYLAIINESAGLLDDLAGMALRGKPLDPERLKSVVERIGRQIEKADGVIKNMNRFAHTTDTPVCSVDVGEVLELVALLAARKAAMQKVVIKVDVIEAVTLTTNVFLFESLLFLLLLTMAEQVPGHDLAVTGKREGERVVVHVVRGNAAGGFDPMGSQDISILLAALQAKAEATGDGCLVRLPVALAV